MTDRSPTNQPADRPTDRQTERPFHKEVTHKTRSNRDNMGADEKGELLGDEVGEVDQRGPLGRVPGQNKQLNKDEP